jgi:hypothetical protein
MKADAALQCVDGQVHYLIPVVNGGCPWEREQVAAEKQGSR